MTGEGRGGGGGGLVDRAIKPNMYDMRFFFQTSGVHVREFVEHDSDGVGGEDLPKARC